MTPSKFEQDSIVASKADEWQTWDSVIYVYRTEKHGLNARVHIPATVVDFLNLNHKDNVRIAIKKPLREERIIKRVHRYIPTIPKYQDYCTKKKLVNPSCCVCDGYRPYHPLGVCRYLRRNLSAFEINGLNRMAKSVIEIVDKPQRDVAARTKP